jgi:hypothetical protein
MIFMRVRNSSTPIREIESQESRARRRGLPARNKLDDISVLQHPALSAVSSGIVTTTWLAVAVMVGGCHAPAPAPVRETTPSELAVQLRTDVDALVNHYVHGSFKLGHKQDGTVQLAPSAALAAAHKLGQMLVHPTRGSVRCEEHKDGVVCTQSDLPGITLWLVRYDGSFILRSAAVAAPPSRVTSRAPLVQPLFDGDAGTFVNFAPAPPK